MKHVLLFSAACCMLSSPIAAQMNMPGMADVPALNPNHEEQHHTQSLQHLRAQPPQEGSPPVPFGRVADGDTSQIPRSVPATISPVVLDGSVQEQEHPAQHTGSSGMPAVDLLADVKERAPQPIEFFTAKAMTNNPTLRQAEAQVRRLRAEAKQAGLWSNPEIGYEADHIRGGSYHSGEQGGYVQQTVPLAGQRSASRAAVEAQATQAEAVFAAQQQRVRAAVAQAFYAALAMQREVEVRGELARLAADSTAGVHQLANLGQADAPDVLQSEVEREQAKLDLATAQRGYRKSFALLAAVSGDNGLPVSQLEGDLQAVPQLATGTAEAAAESSPALRIAQAQVAASDAALRSERRQQLPQLTVHAGLQQDNEPLESSRGRVGVVGVAQAGITLPLWNRNQGAVEAAKAARMGADAEAARTRLALHLQAEQAMQDYASAMATVSSYRDELLPRAERSHTLYLQKYAAMAAAYPQVVLSERTLLQLQLDYVRALGAAWQGALLLQHGLLADGLAQPTRVGTETSAVQESESMR